MKKSLFTILLTLLPLLASADDPVEINGIYYNLFSKGNVAEVAANPNEYSGDVVIPKKVKYEGVSYSVRSIGEKAFKSCYDLTSVTIPVGVTSISKDAFAYCKGLTSVTIPEGVTYIEDDAFRKCVELTSVTIPNSVNKIGMFVFSGCEKLKSITIPEGVTTIDIGAFEYCHSLSSVTIPSTVKDIHVYAFYDTSLKSVTIPPNVNSIYSRAFGNCKQLQDVYCYPEKIRYVNANVFEGSYPEYIRLHVPAAYMDNYDNEPWSLFNRIVKITGKVKLDKAKATIQKGKSMTLKATVTPSTLLDKSVIWKSSNTAVATVTSAGKVKGVKTGTATITCISNLTGAKATCKVTVGYVKLDKTEAVINKGKTVTLKATVYPSTLEDKSVTWESSDTKIATVSSRGKVKGVRTGTAIITCTSVATGLSTTCEVTVGSVMLDQTEVAVNKGKTVTLKATVYPTTLEDKSVIWESSNTKVATVTSAGKVKGIKAGTTTITCTSNATGLKTTCKVTVTASAGSRSLDGDDDELTDIEEVNERLTEDPAFIEPFDVYDLSGRKVRHQVTSLDGLPDGIYIVNGKKIFKK